MKSYYVMVGSTPHIVKAKTKAEAIVKLKKKLGTTKIKSKDVYAYPPTRTSLYPKKK